MRQSGHAAWSENGSLNGRDELPVKRRAISIIPSTIRSDWHSRFEDQSQTCVTTLFLTPGGPAGGAWVELA